MKKRFEIFIHIAFFAAFVFSCVPEKTNEKPESNINHQSGSKTPIISYKVVSTFPHDSTCFTEGFFFHEGRLFESSGAPDNLPATRSLFGIVDQKTGKIDVKGELDRNKYFGEGIVILKDKLYQLTWQGQNGFIYDAKTFRNIGTFSYMSKEGWGLTTDGKDLIMSDGTDALTFIDPENYKITKTLLVSENNYALDHLNELEYVNGSIYAAIWMTGTVVRIDPETGNVTGKLDLTDLDTEARKRYRGSLELNGIAYDPQTGRLLITGKMWPTVYEIKINP